MMCGIAGLIAPEPRALGEPIRAMAGAIRHRGPDDEGYVVFAGPELTPSPFGGDDTTAAAYDGPRPYAPARTPPAPADALVALGHRRLAIVDLSAAGHQPMATADGRLWIVYNGEVYNHLELRRELEPLGARFQSHADTEVILEAYRHWGLAGLHRLNGMFAFVLLDRAERRLVAVRDRFGVKPLYLWRGPDGLLAFASEIKQLAVLPGWRAALHGQGAYDFLRFGLLDHTGGTLFEGVRQLRGGELLEAPLAGLARAGPRAWYRLEPRPFAGTLPEAAGELRRLLTDSVRLRLRADVPVGSCLSGGLDSSSIVCLASALLRASGTGAQHTFSARAEVDRFDESRHAEEVIRATGVAAHFTTPALADLFAILPRLTWHQDEPFGSTSIFAQWAVFQLAARHGIKVMLDGQGADELLAGYHDFFGVRFASLARSFRLVELLVDGRATARLHGYTPLDLIRRGLTHLLPEAAREPLRVLFRKDTARSDRWLNAAALGVEPTNPAGWGEARGIPAVSDAMVARTSLPMLLHYEDRNSMAHSVESRVPFLDYRLAELLLGLPDEHKLARGITKRVLREALQGVLPESIRQRHDKLGFATPEEVWMRERAPEAFRRAARTAVEQAGGVLRPGALALVDETLAGERPFSFLPWRMISFGAWMQRCSVSVRP